MSVDVGEGRCEWVEVSLLVAFALAEAEGARIVADEGDALGRVLGGLLGGFSGERGRDNVPRARSRSSRSRCAWLRISLSRSNFLSLPFGSFCSPHARGYYSSSGQPRTVCG
jgi:hypothetical protein